MKIVSGKLVMTLALLLVLLATSLPGCGGSAPSLPIEAQLSFSEPPVLDKPVEITATFNLMIDYPIISGITTRIILPEGFEKVDGVLWWQGDIIRGNTYTLNAIIKAVKNGDWKIEVRASSGKSDGMGGYTVLYVSVSETDATVGDRPSGIGCRGPYWIGGYTLVPAGDVIYFVIKERVHPCSFSATYFTLSLEKKITLLFNISILTKTFT